MLGPGGLQKFNAYLIAGRVTAHDVAAFARDSVGIRLEALGPRDFESSRVGPSSHDAWFIDFFAPVSTMTIVWI